MRDGQLSKARFLLFISEDVNSSFLQAANSLAASLDGLLLIRQSQDEGIRLVRPDGYAAFSAPASHSRDAMQIVSALLNKMLNRGDLGATKDLEHAFTDTSNQGERRLS